VRVGKTLVQKFKVECAGWLNCLSVNNDIMTYSYFVAFRHQRALLPLYSERNTSVSLNFPAGDPNDNHHNKVYVQVSNAAGYETEVVIYPVRVSVRNSVVLQCKCEY